MASGKILKEIMEKEGITAAELYRRTGIPATTIRSAISNDSELKVSTLFTIANALGYDPSKLMTEAISESNLDHIDHALLNCGYYVVKTKISDKTVNVRRLEKDTVEYVVDKRKLYNWFRNTLKSAKPFLDDLISESKQVDDGNEEN